MVNLIYFENRRKLARTITTAEEFHALRNSAHQTLLVDRVRQTGDIRAKKQLLQFNYSCIITGGRLRGSKTPAATIGMDIDAPHILPAKGTPGYMGDTEAEWLEAVPQRVMDHKDELGLLLLERSCRHGYHLVFRRREFPDAPVSNVAANQEANLKWASQLIGVPFDEGAKDVTRVFFATTSKPDDLLYFDPAIFDTTMPTGTDPSTSRPLAPAAASRTAPAAASSAPVSVPFSSLSASSSSAGSASPEADAESASATAVSPDNKLNDSDFDSDINNADTPGSAADNDADNGLDNAPGNDADAVSAAAPGTSPDEPYPYAQIIARYVDKYWGGKEPCVGDRNTKTYELASTLACICDYSPAMLEQVIPRYAEFDIEEWRATIASAAQQTRRTMPIRLSRILSELRQEALTAETTGSEQMPEMPTRLPRLIKLLVSKTPQRYWPAVAEAVFPALGAHLHGVKFRYVDNVDHEPTFMNVLIAPMSSGKSTVKKPIEYIMADIRERDQASRQREAEWKQANPSNATKKEPRPTNICIQMLVDNLTDAAFNQRVVDAERNGHRFIYTIVDEVESLKNVTSRGRSADVSLLIRKAFDNADHGQERVSTDSISGIAPLRWNWNASTTPQNARQFFNKAISDGTLSRLTLSTIVCEDPYDNAELPIMGIYDDKFAKDLRPYIVNLSTADGLVECKAAKRLALKLVSECQERAQIYGSEAYLQLSYRATVIAYLKAMTLYVAEGCKWSKTIEDYVRWSLRFDLWTKMRFFGTQLEGEMQKDRETVNLTPRNLIAQLPEEFTFDEYLHLRKKNGSTSDAQTLLRKWKQRGYVDYDSIADVYSKTARGREVSARR